MAERILSSIFRHFDAENQPYCVLHGYESYPDDIPSDVDVIVALDHTTKSLAELLSETGNLVGADLIQWLQHESSAYYAVLANIWETMSPENRFLRFDASTDYRRNGRIFFSGEEILGNRRRFRSFWIPSPAHEFTYYLIKRVAKGALSDHHGRRLSAIFANDPDTCKVLLARFWNDASRLALIEAAETGDWSAIQQGLKQLRTELLRQTARREPAKAVGYFLANLRRLSKRIRQPTGLMIVLLGPDGSGKSTVIDPLLRELAAAFRHTSRRHFAPNCFRRGADGNPVTEPHGTPPRPLALSAAKLGYWVVDYWLGYITSIRPALTHSTFVVFDRYLHDVLVDPKRYRYGGPRWAVRAVLRLIPGPDLVILLDAPPEVLQARKQEVSFAETARQRAAYRALVESLPNGHVVDATRTLEEVTETICKIILVHLADRTAGRLKLPRSAAAARTKA